MLDDSELELFQSDLQSPVVGRRIDTLGILCGSPTGDERLVPYVEALLTDNAIGVIGIPFQYGEVRWVAASALRAERAKMGIHTPIKLENTFYPLMDDEIDELAVRAGLSKANRAGEIMIKKMEELREMGALPLIDREWIP